MTNIGGGGGVNRPGQPQPDTPSEPGSTANTNANAVADAQKAAHKNVQVQQEVVAQQSDAFQQHEQSAHVTVSKEELEKAHVAFTQKFPPDVVKFIANGLNAKIDPYKTMQTRTAILNSPVGRQAIEDVKVALEEGAQALARPPPGADNQPLQTGAPALLQAEGLLPGQLPKPILAGGLDGQTPGRVLNANDPLNPNNKPIDPKPPAAPPKPATTTTDKLTDQALANKNAAADAAKKLVTQTATDAKNAVDAKNPPAPPPPPAPLPKAGALLPGESAGADTAPPPPPPPAGGVVINESSGAQTNSNGGGSGTGGGTGSGESSAALGSGTGPNGGPPVFGGGSAPLSPLAKKATISLKQMQDLLASNAGPEAALVVLMAAIEDVDKDLQNAQNMLKVRHEVNNAMRDYIAEFNKQTWKMGDNNFEWQRMTFTVGYDKAGNVFVQSYPDVTWETGTPQHETGKGTSDITPEKGFATAVGTEGVTEAQANGSYHMLDGNTCVGLTSHRALNASAIPAETSYNNSVMSSMKEEDEKWTMNLQNMMDTRKNMLQQFSKIYTARSDSWAQQIAQLVQ